MTNNQHRSALLRIPILILSMVLLSAAPVFAQTPTAEAVAVANGDITPAGLLVFGGVLLTTIFGGVFAIVTRLMDDRFDKEKAVRKEEADRQQQIARQTDAIVTLGKGMSDFALTSTTERAAGAEERKEFRVTLDQNTQKLKDHADQLKRLSGAVDALVTDTKSVQDLVRLIQARIGGTQDDLPLTALLMEAAMAAKQAEETIKQVAQTVIKSSTPDAPASDDLPSSSQLPGIPLS